MTGSWGDRASHLRRASVPPGAAERPTWGVRAFYPGRPSEVAVPRFGRRYRRQVGFQPPPDGGKLLAIG